MKFLKDVSHDPGHYICPICGEQRPENTPCPCFRSLPSASPDPVPVEGTPCAGCGTITPESDLWEPSATDRIGRPHLLAGEFYCRTCLGLAAAPEPDPVPSSRPVTFAAVLRYHRLRAQARDGDPAWHAEAVECLVALVNHFDRCDAECECCDMADCYLREARNAVEGEG